MGKRISEYVDNINSVIDSDIITVEHRSNNPKRDFLFCNKCQGKHIPTDPNNFIHMMNRLIYNIGDNLDTYKVLVIGFAETATAIGSYIADNLKSCVYYLQTSRERIFTYRKIIEFKEEHSHATEQYLFGNIDQVPQFDYILFVDDEISTGNTILNFIHEFNELNSNVKYGVASICNWQNAENKSKYSKLGIDIFYIIGGTIKDIHQKMPDEIAKQTINTIDDNSARQISKVNYYTINHNIFYKERTGRFPKDKEYNDIIPKIINVAKSIVAKSKNILVIGTEEFMRIPIEVANKLSNMGYNVVTQSTTRSSIDILKYNTGDYKNELVNKSVINSPYDSSRITYIYNLKEYDKIIVISDTLSDTDVKKQFSISLALSLIKYKNLGSNINFMFIEE